MTIRSFNARNGVSVGAGIDVIDSTGAFTGDGSAITNLNLSAAASGVLPGLYGGTGVANSGRTITLAGNLATTGAFNTTLAQTASVTLTLPAVSGTLVTLAGTETLSAKTLASPVATTQLTTTSATFSLLDTTATTINFGGAASTMDIGAAAGTVNFGGVVRLPAGGDATLASTTHAFQIGLTSGANVIIDNNEIMARNNGATSSLSLNIDGGNITLGDATSTVTVPGAMTVNGLISATAVPTADGHLANKLYVDNAAAGTTFVAGCVAATTANITLSAPQTIDGIAVVAGNRVLVKNQTTTTQNGIYVVAAGAWTRATDYDVAAEVNKTSVFVSSGTVNAATAWAQTATITTVGTQAMVFAQTSAANSYTGGAGMVLSGNTFNVQTASAARIVVNADNIDLATVGTAGTYYSVTTDAYGRVSAGSTTFGLSTGAAGVGAITQGMAGVELVAASMSTTNKYTPAVKFGSTDPQFTTVNPKFGAAIVGEATQTYSLDTEGGMGLAFFVTPNTPGAAGGMVEEMRISQTGVVTMSAGVSSTSTATGTLVVNGGIGASENVNALTFRAGAGAAATPSIAFTGDDNTGLYNIAGTTLGFSVNGVSELTITGGLASFGGKVAVSATGTSLSIGSQAGAAFQLTAGTINDTAAAGTIAVGTSASFSAPTFTATNARIYTSGSALFVAGPAVASTNVTITAPHAVHVASGRTFLGTTTSTAALPALAVRDVNTGLFSDTTGTLSVTTAGTLAATFGATGTFTSVGAVVAPSADFSGTVNIGNDLVFDGSTSVISSSLDTGYTYITGGSSTSLGAAIIMYGSTHGSLANVGRLRTGSTTVLEWNAGVMAATGTFDVISTARSGATASTSADDIVIDASVAAGLSILVPDGTVGSIGFGSPADGFTGGIQVTTNATSTNSTMTIIAGNATAMTLSNTLVTVNNAMSISPGAITGTATSANGSTVSIVPSTFTAATGAIATRTAVSFGQPTFAAAGASVYTNASSVYIAGPAIAGTNATLTNTHALHIASGRTQMAAGSATVPALAVRDENTGIYSSATNTLNVATNGALAATFASGGDFTAVGDITAFSDARKKTEIFTIPAALDKVEGMRGVMFTRTADSRKSTGVIAQEIAAVMPEVVHMDEEGYLSVAYGNLVGVLIEAVKELSAKVKALEAAAK
jgi:hypothetical protein